MDGPKGVAALAFAVLNPPDDMMTEQFENAASCERKSIEKVRVYTRRPINA